MYRIRCAGHSIDMRLESAQVLSFYSRFQEHRGLVQSLLPGSPCLLGSLRTWGLGLMHRQLQKVTISTLFAQTLQICLCLFCIDMEEGFLHQAGRQRLCVCEISHPALRLQKHVATPSFQDYMLTQPALPHFPSASSTNLVDSSHTLHADEENLETLKNYYHHSEMLNIIHFDLRSFTLCFMFLYL